MIYNLFPKFHVRHEGDSFHGSRNSDAGAYTKAYLINIFYPIRTQKSKNSAKCIYIETIHFFIRNIIIIKY